MRYPTTASVKATSKRTTNTKAAIHSKALSKLVLMLSLFLMLTISGCIDDSETANKEAHSAQDKKQEPLKPQPKTVTIYHMDNSKIEDINDKSSYDKPRLQFLWQTPFGKERGLWSIKIDGTDLRRVIPYSELYQDDPRFGVMEVPPVRSPNNRYIAISRYKNKLQTRTAVMVYDMQEKRWIHLPSDKRTYWAAKEIVWLPDSSGFHYLGQNLKSYFYNISDKTISNVPFKRGILHLNTNGNYISSYDKGDDTIFYEMDKNGIILNEFKIPQINEGKYRFNLHGFDSTGGYVFFEEKHWKWRKFPTKAYIFDVKNLKISKEIEPIDGDILYASIAKDLIYSFDGIHFMKSSPSLDIHNEIIFFFRPNSAAGYRTNRTIYNLGDLAK